MKTKLKGNSSSQCRIYIWGIEKLLRSLGIRITAFGKYQVNVDRVQHFQEMNILLD